MTQPANRDSSGTYRHPQTGEEFPSYSSIAGMLNKPGLLYWAANRVAHAAVWDPHGVSHRAAQLHIEAFDSGKAVPLEECFYHALRGAPWRERDEKADLGTAVHAAIERYQQEDLPGIYPASVAPYMVQFEGFLRNHKPHIVANEVTIYNRTIGYAGTLDILANLNIPGTHGPGQLAIIDIKTGKNVYPDAAIQQNAYANGEVFYDEWERKDIDMPEVEAAYVLHIQSTHYKLIPVTLSQTNFDVFCALRQVWDWDRNGAKNAALGKAVRTTARNSQTKDLGGMRIPSRNETVLAPPPG